MFGLRIWLLSFFAAAAFFNQVYAARDFRLRANVEPPCSSSNQWKYSDLHADGDLVVMGSYNCRGVFIFDISNPDEPSLRSWYNPGANLQFLEAVVIGNIGYFGTGNNAGGNGGVHIVDLSDPSAPSLLGRVHSGNGGYNTIHEIVVFDQDGQRYLIENSNTTADRPLRIINVTNPASPFLVHILTPGEVQWVHAVHIRGNRMYTSGWGNASNRARTEIWDIENLATRMPVLLGTIIDPSSNVTAGNSMHSSWTSEDGNFLYSAREVGGSAANGPNAGDLRVYNVSDPANPLLIKKIRTSDLGLNAVTPHNPVVKGNRLYVSWYQAGTQVFDISNPADPVRIGQFDTYAPEYVPKPQEPGLSDEPWDMVCGRSELSGFVPTSYDGNWSAFPFLGEDRVLLSDLSGGLFVVNTVIPNPVSDFDGDRKTDISLFNPATGSWNYIYSVNGRRFSIPWGVSIDIPVAGDYDGDGRSDLAVYRPGPQSTWFINRSSQGISIIPWGTAGDVPVVGDYDGDYKTDIAVWRPSTGVWWILMSGGGVRVVAWGLSVDKPLAGDYDGDGRTDIGVWRPANGTWYILKSSDNSGFYAAWGIEGDKPLVADLDGNGRTDLIVFRPSNGTWYAYDPMATPTVRYLNWGVQEDIPLPADYDGDGRSDLMVYRPSIGMWFGLDSSSGDFRFVQFGAAGDKPSPASAQPY